MTVCCKHNEKSSEGKPFPPPPEDFEDVEVAKKSNGSDYMQDVSNYDYDGDYYHDSTYQISCLDDNGQPRKVGVFSSLHFQVRKQTDKLSFHRLGWSLSKKENV